MVQPLRERYTVQVGPLYKKILQFFLFCSQSIIIDILLKTLRRNIKIELNYVVGWQSRSFLTGLLQYLAKNVAVLVQQIIGEKTCSKSVFD